MKIYMCNTCFCWSDECDCDLKNRQWDFTNVKPDIEEIKRRFLNGDQISFGNDDQGICSMAKLCDTKKEFYAAYCEDIEDTFDIDDFVELYIYYSPSLVDEDCNGITGQLTKATKHTGDEDWIFIGLFWGTEY